MDNKYTDYAKDHLKNVTEYGQNLFSTAKTTSNDVASKITEVLADNIELGKSYLNCKSFGDLVDWSEKLVHTNLDHCAKVGSEVYHKACAEVTKANSDIAKKAGECISKTKQKFDQDK